MLSVRIKGSRDPQNVGFVKLTMVFYKRGYPRVTKVMPVTGLFDDWDPKAQGFRNTLPEYTDKNRILMKERFKYLKIAEKWEHENKNWIPVELSHYFDDRKKFRERYITVSGMIDKVIEELNSQERFKNGRIFKSETTAENYLYLKRSIEVFVSKKCRMDFSKLQFRDMDEKFLKDFVFNEMKSGYKNGTRGGIGSKLKTLRAVCAKAKDEGVYGINLAAFIPLKKKVKNNFHTPKAISQETMRRIEQFDRTKLVKKENMYLDLFLFSYYAGGMSGIDICYMEHSWIKGETIIYERIKEDKVAKVILIDKAKAIIEKYRKEGYMNYVFPIFKLKKLTQTQMYNRVGNITINISKTLTKICTDLGIKENITWSSARSTFISKMLDDGYHVYQVAEMTGNSPATIYKYYYGITNPEELKENMNERL